MPVAMRWSRPAFRSSDSGKPMLPCSALAECGPVPGGPSVVHQQHGEAVVGVGEAAGVVRVGVVVLGPAVHRHDRGERALAVGPDQPALDAVVRGVREPHGLERAARRRALGLRDPPGPPCRRATRYRGGVDPALRAIPDRCRRGGSTPAVIVPPAGTTTVASPAREIDAQQGVARLVILAEQQGVGSGEPVLQEQRAGRFDGDRGRVRPRRGPTSTGVRIPTPPAAGPGAGRPRPATSPRARSFSPSSRTSPTVAPVSTSRTRTASLAISPSSEWRMHTSVPSLERPPGPCGHSWPSPAGRAWR